MRDQNGLLYLSNSKWQSAICQLNLNDAWYTALFQYWSLNSMWHGSRLYLLPASVWLHWFEWESIKMAAHYKGLLGFLSHPVCRKHILKKMQTQAKMMAKPAKTQTGMKRFLEMIRSWGWVSTPSLGGPSPGGNRIKNTKLYSMLL